MYLINPLNRFDVIDLRRTRRSTCKPTCLTGHTTGTGFASGQLSILRYFAGTIGPEIIKIKPVEHTVRSIIDFGAYIRWSIRLCQTSVGWAHNPTLTGRRNFIVDHVNRGVCTITEAVSVVSLTRKYGLDLLGKSSGINSCSYVWRNCGGRPVIDLYS